MSGWFWYFLAGMNGAWGGINFRAHSWGWFAANVAMMGLATMLGHSAEQDALQDARTRGWVDAVLDQGKRRRGSSG